MEDFEKVIKGILSNAMYFAGYSPEEIETYSPVLSHALSLKGKQFLNVSFVDDLGLDSLEAIELVMSVEEEFDISISDEDVTGIVKVKNLKECIDSKKRGDNKWEEYIQGLLRTDGTWSHGRNLAFSNPIRTPFQI